MDKLVINGQNVSLPSDNKTVVFEPSASLLLFQPLNAVELTPL